VHLVVRPVPDAARPGAAVAPTPPRPRWTARRCRPRRRLPRAPARGRPASRDGAGSPAGRARGAAATDHDPRPPGVASAEATSSRSTRARPSRTGPSPRVPWQRSRAPGDPPDGGVADPRTVDSSRRARSAPAARSASSMARGRAGRGRSRRCRSPRWTPVTRAVPGPRSSDADGRDPDRTCRGRDLAAAVDHQQVRAVAGQPRAEAGPVAPRPAVTAERAPRQLDDVRRPRSVSTPRDRPSPGSPASPRGAAGRHRSASAPRSRPRRTRRGAST
jgi:hypothetical protein